MFNVLIVTGGCSFQFLIILSREVWQDQYTDIQMPYSRTAINTLKQKGFEEHSSAHSKHTMRAGDIITVCRSTSRPRSTDVFNTEESVISIVERTCNARILIKICIAVGIYT